MEEKQNSKGQNAHIMERRIVEFIRENGSATYSEIEDVMSAAGFKWEGRLCSCSNMNSHVIFWDGWNNEALSLISKMIRSGTIAREPCHWLNYLVGGKCLNLPLVKHCTEYKTDHWLPCLFVLGKRES